MTALGVNAEIYQYEDKFGKKIYVDSLSKVPPEYRDQLTSPELQEQNLSQEQLDALDNKVSKTRALYLINREQSKIKDQLKQWITPFSLIANRVVVPVKVTYGYQTKQLSLVIDTGASVTVIHRSAVESFNPSYRKGAYARIADGSVVKTEKITFDRVEIGPYKVNNIVSTVIDYRGGSGGSNGLLGMDFLFNAKYDLDKEKRQIIWEPELYAKYQEKLKQLEVQKQQLRKDAVPPAQ
jgi:hypothetical protein